MSRKNFKNTVDAMKYRINYMNESPKYRSLVSDTDEYDEIPSGIFEAGEEDLPPEQQGIPPVDPNAAPSPDAAPPAPDAMPPADPNAPAPDAMPPADPNAPAPDSGMGTTPPPPVGEVQPEEPDVDTLQNDIIKHNITAMQDLHQQLQSLSSLADSLNSKMDVLSKDVEEVREPTNGEKLANKANVSYPYYLNLSDMWDKNWFNEKRNDLNEKGINKLEDGTYVADFDDLPKQSNLDVKNSFNLYESVFDPTQSIINGRSKQTAINIIYKKITPLINGFFKDEDWSGVRRVWKTFEELNLDWCTTGNEYYGGMPPQGKRWTFEIEFTDNAGKLKKIFGNLTAAGAGSIQDPLDRYDISVVLS